MLFNEGIRNAFLSCKFQTNVPIFFRKQILKGSGGTKLFEFKAKNISKILSFQRKYNLHQTTLLGVDAKWEFSHKLSYGASMQFYFVSEN